MNTLIHIKRALHALRRDEDGAVTVDWIVLTAAIVGMGMVLGFTATANLPGFAQRISSSISKMPVTPQTTTPPSGGGGGGGG